MNRPLPVVFAVAALLIPACATSIARDPNLQRNYEPVPNTSFASWILADQIMGKNISTTVTYKFTIPGMAVWADYDDTLWIAVSANGDTDRTPFGVLIPRKSPCAEALPKAESGAALTISGGVYPSTQKRAISSVIVADSCSFGENPVRMKVVQ